MKKILLTLILCFAVIAYAQEPQGPQGLQEIVPVAQQESQGNITPGLVKTQTSEQVRERIQVREQELAQQIQTKEGAELKAYQNQNQVRLAVHALLEMEGVVGGIGPQVSEIARQFNNSVQATLRSEHKIYTKSGFARFFTGGDEKSAEEIEGLVNQNQVRLQEMNQLMNQCECDEEARIMLQEQIQVMEQEQNRLNELANKEKKSKGLLGWIWK